MINFNHPFILTLSGILLITLFNVLGAILSRKLNFNYSTLTLFSIAIYIFIAFLIAKHSDLAHVLISTIALGMFDAIIGWELSIKFNANLGPLKDELQKIPVQTRVLLMIILSGLFGFIGYWLS